MRMTLLETMSKQSIETHFVLALGYFIQKIVLVSHLEARSRACAHAQNALVESFLDLR